MSRIEQVYAEFNKRLSTFGAVVIAGGAVRDSLRGKEPKDWDIFVLQPNGFDFAATRDGILKVIGDLPVVKSVVSWHRSEPYLVATIRWEGQEVQILVNPQPDKAALVGTFDWNVCLFAYDGEYLRGEELENIAEGKPLRLNTVTFPMSTLRRGYRFSERFKMQLERDTVVTLCRQIVENADKKLHAGPKANEPDMPALAANMLPEEAPHAH